MSQQNGYIGRSPGDSAVIIASQTFEPTGIQTDFTFAAGYDPNEAAEMMYNGLPDMSKALYNFAVEGTASNAVHLRNQLIKAGVNKSEIEKMGAGFGGYVYNQETYLGNDIPGKVGTNTVGGIVTKKAISKVLSHNILCTLLSSETCDIFPSSFSYISIALRYFE